MKRFDAHLRRQLDARRAAGALRSLVPGVTGADFCSNDYLGFATLGLLDAPGARSSARPQPPAPGSTGDTHQRPSGTGSTGSRLISGNTHAWEALEARIAAFHDAPFGLIFNSGYDANVGLFSAIAREDDVVIFDALIHASVRDGIRLARARGERFRHSDLNDLETQLRVARESGGAGVGTSGARGAQQIYVAVESIYSMDGDAAPLAEMATLCERYDAALIVDEAHATGVIGARGEGAVAAAGLRERVFARVHTFGKALGAHGAIVLGSETLREYLVNYARSLTYSTFLPPATCVAIDAGYRLLETEPHHMKTLHERVALLRSATDLHSDSAIHAMIVPGNDAVVAAAARMQAHDCDARAIRYPSVPRGAERIRICVHAFNTTEEIARLAAAVAEIRGAR